MSLYDLAGDGSDPSNNGNMLAAMLAQHMAMSGANNGPVRSPSQGASNMPNSLISWALMHPEQVQALRTGIGNMFSGYNPNGTAASWGAMPGLSAQAAGNIAGGAAI